MPPSQSDRSSSEQQWCLVDDAVRQLEEAWQAGPAPPLERFLPSRAEAQRRRVLVELIGVDQEYRWQHGDERRVESYLADWPELATSPETVVELVRAECLTRAFLRKAPDPEEIRTRFPELSGGVDLAGIRTTADRESVCREPGSLAPSGPRAALAPGARLARYEIRERIGRGGMGTVYRAYDTSLLREVALKVPHFDPGVDPRLRERFLREARSAAALRHPHVCPVYDAGETDGFCYIAMAFIEGPSLATRLREQIFAPREAVELVHKVAGALDAVHRAGVLHRDIKASNVLLDRNGEPMLTDFGLARPLHPGGDISLDGSFLGTPAYMSPEQVAGDPSRIDARSDVYGLGMLLYELLCGSLPFHGNMADVLHQVSHATPRPPSSVRPEIDSAIERICMRALAKRPEDRFESAAAMANALAAYLRTTQPVPPVLMRSRVALVGALAAAAVAVAAMTIRWETGEGTVVVEVNQPDVTATIDGERLQITSPRDRIEVRLRAGKHELEVTREGFTAYTREFTVRRGGTEELRAVLQPNRSEPTTRSIDVPADHAWVATGVMVAPGTVLQIEASGRIDASGPLDDREYYHDVPPQGRELRQEHLPFPSLPGLALIGKIGNGVAFYVGRRIELRLAPADGAGELHLGVNDDIVEDNSGSWTARITTEPHADVATRGVRQPQGVSPPRVGP